MYDIGSIYSEGVFTVEQYVDVENLYVNAVIGFMNCLNINSLKVVGLEKHSVNIEILDFSELYNEEMVLIYSRIEDGCILNKSEVKSICRLILRDNLWCKLIFESDMYVHFGYEYYMFIGSSDRCDSTVESIASSGLYVELFESPINVEND